MIQCAHEGCTEEARHFVAKSKPEKPIGYCDEHWKDTAETHEV